MAHGVDTRSERIADCACPAGSPTYDAHEGAGVMCGLTELPIYSHSDPGSLITFCCHPAENDRVGYSACPVWRDAREREWAQRETAREEEARRTSTTREERQEERIRVLTGEPR